MTKPILGLLKTSLDRCGLSEPARAVKRLVPETAISRRSRRDDEHLQLLCAFQLRMDSNCIDVGAHTGEITDLFLRYAPGGKHIAYEPLPELAAALAARLPEVDVRRRALSNVAGNTTFTFVKSNPAYSGFRERSYPGRESLEQLIVQTECLDEALPPDYVPDLIKIDVEGAEQLVLEGAMRTLKTHKPVVVFEHGPGAASRYGTRSGDIYRLLVLEAGLRVFDMDGNGPMSASDFGSARGFGHWNFVAHR